MMDIFKDTSALLILASVLLMSYFYLTSRRGKNYPPGPFALPILGNIPFAEKHKRNLHIKLNTLKAKYGDVISLCLGKHFVVFLSSYDSIKESILDQADSYSDRSEYVNEVSYRGSKLIKEAIIGSSGERWKKIRKAVVVALRDMGVGKKTIEHKIAEEAGYILDELQKHESKPFDMHTLITYAVSNIINNVVFGERFEYSDKQFVDMVDIMNQMFDAFLIGEPGLYSPLVTLLYTLDFKRGAGLDKLSEDLTDFHNEKVQEHRKTFNKDEIRDVIDVCIAADIDDPNSETFTAATVVGVVDDLFQAGSETTNTTLRWLFLQMLRHPEIQEKCYNEIETIFGTERLPSAKERSECHYINATLNENQRVSNIVPLSLLHTTNKITNIQGYEIPEGALICYNMYSVHMDDNNFLDAKDFKPERWLDSEGKFQKLERYIPFGTGRRSCAGEQLARIELFLFFTVLIQKYKFMPEKGIPLPKDEEAVLGLTLLPPDYKVVAIRR